MNRPQKVAVAVSALTIAGLIAVAAPTLAAAASTISSWPLFAPASADPTGDNARATVAPPTPTPIATSDDPLDGCLAPAWISTERLAASVTGRVEDRGARPYAQGTVGVDDDGTITSYTVADGDGFTAIGERLCIRNPMMLDVLNHSRDIFPGQVLRLTQDPDVPHVPFFNPPDAAEGFPQIPYQQAIVEMRKAANAGDVTTMQTIWFQRLAPMFPVRADVDLISAVVEAGDIAVLRQMFA